MKLQNPAFSSINLRRPQALSCESWHTHNLLIGEAGLEKAGRLRCLLMPCDENRHKWAPHTHIPLTLLCFSPMVSLLVSIACKWAGSKDKWQELIAIPIHTSSNSCWTFNTTQHSWNMLNMVDWIYPEILFTWSSYYPVQSSLMEINSLKRNNVLTVKAPLLRALSVRTEERFWYLQWNERLLSIVLSPLTFFWHNLDFLYEKHENNIPFSKMWFVYKPDLDGRYSWSSESYPCPWQWGWY